MDHHSIPSPCIGICQLDRHRVCAGCGRTVSEIAQWSTLDAASKRHVVSASRERLEQRARIDGSEQAGGNAPSQQAGRQAVQRLAPGGFTLVELLAVIALIGILVALMLPAVQSTREAMRRIQCVNHLRQIGIGFHNYHGVYRQFPIGGAGAVSTTHPVIRRWWRPSWGTVLLPFIEQQPLYESIELDAPYVDAVNHEAGGTIVPTYLCPSAAKGVMRRPNGDTPWSPTRFARTDYGGNYGERGLRCLPRRDCANNYAELGDADSGGRGVLLFATDPAIGMRDILDGASHTVIAGEAPEGLHSIWIGHKNFFDQSAPISARVDAQTRWSSCAPPLASPHGDFCDFGQEFHSYHPGGAHFLMVDGSARFVTAQTDLKIFAAVLSRRGGEVVPEF